MFRRVTTTLAVAAAIGVLAVAGVSGAAAVKPGTAAQITTLVANSAKITSLSPTVAAELPNAASDFSWTAYPTLDPYRLSDCLTVTACVYGDPTSSKIIVLFGDSHAVMWLPALVPVATKNHDRLVLLWQIGCPAATVSVYAPNFGDPSACNTWRSTALGEITGLDPALVILGEKTSQNTSAPGVPITATQWRSGLEATIAAVARPTTKVAVLEDTVTFNSSVPGCLATYPTAVKKCAVPFLNTTNPGLQSSEQAAAKASKALYVETQKWFCTKVCAGVIGSFIPYIDTNHVSFAYAAYLSGVLGDALKPVLPKG